jgi:NTE family protein
LCCKAEEIALKEKSPKIVLVLGSVGSRGIFYIGVLGVLQEEQISIDLVVGTSIGSIVGTFYCAGVSVEKLENFAKGYMLERYFKF